MSLNINGYNISNTGGLVFGSSSTRIDNSGRITDPFLPAMFGAQTNFAGTHRQYPWQVDSQTLNVNGVWGSSTTFTCPVAGIYLASCAYLSGLTGATGYGQQAYDGLIKNGGLVYFTYADTDNIWRTQHLEVLIKCAAGDTLAWAMNIAPAPDSTTGAGSYGSNHNNACIWLVG